MERRQHERDGARGGQRRPRLAQRHRRDRGHGARYGAHACRCARLALDVSQEVAVGGAVQGIGLPSPAPASRFEYSFDVAPDDARVAVVLDWTDELNDLDFTITDPDGDTPTTAGATAAKPERAALFHPVFHPKPGTWTIRVTAFQLVVPDTFELEVRLSPQSGVPFVHPLDAYRFGSLDVQKVPLRVQWSDSWTGAWDLDADGVHETTSPSPTTAFATGGPYPVAVKVTTAEGYEGYRARTVTVLDTAEHVIRWGCGGAHDRPFWAMEYSVSDGTCWYHGGHHTYDLGAGYTLRGLTGAPSRSSRNSRRPRSSAAPAARSSSRRASTARRGRAWASARSTS